MYYLLTQASQGLLPSARPWLAWGGRRLTRSPQHPIIDDFAALIVDDWVVRIGSNDPPLPNAKSEEKLRFPIGEISRFKGVPNCSENFFFVVSH
jgi:hypothetical protein